MTPRRKKSGAVSQSFKRLVKVSGWFLLLWLGGYWHFLANLPTQVLEPGRVTDGIVVLTGSPNRLFEGLDLLRAGKGKRLLFSGVDRTNTREALRRALNENSKEFDCCVDLGWEARDTVGNAAEIAVWAAERNYNSLRVVTSHHHMPRSLVELRRSLPHVELLAHPVFPQRRNPLDLYQRIFGWLQTAGEFNKYFVSLLKVGGNGVKKTGRRPAANDVTAV